MLAILAVWTCFCYVVFRAASRDDLIVLTGPRDSFVNTRELLQKVAAETKRPPPDTDPSGLGGTLTSTTEVNIFEVEPAIDKSPKKTDVAVVKELAGQLPNLPLVYLHENKDKKWHYG